MVGLFEDLSQPVKRTNVGNQVGIILVSFYILALSY